MNVQGAEGSDAAESSISEVSADANAVSGTSAPKLSKFSPVSGHASSASAARDFLQEDPGCEDERRLLVITRSDASYAEAAAFWHQYLPHPAHSKQEI